MFTPADQAAIVDLVAPLIEATLTRGVQQAISASSQPTWRPGTCLAVDTAGLATVLVDGDTAEITAGVIGVSPTVNGRVMVVFVAPAAVFCFAMLDVGPRGVMASVSSTAAIGTTTSTTAVDVSGMTVTFTAVAGRRYRLAGHALLKSSVASDTAALLIATDASVQLAYATALMPTTTATNMPTQVEIEVTPLAAGPVTYKLQYYRALGSGTISVGGLTTAPAWFSAEDVGPA